MCRLKGGGKQRALTGNPQAVFKLATLGVRIPGTATPVATEEISTGEMTHRRSVLGVCLFNQVPPAVDTYASLKMNTFLRT